VDEASTHIDVSRLGISPQCGFASTVAGNPVTEADERAKLTRVVEAARNLGARLTSAADLKFLQQPQQPREGTSNRKAALETYTC
jgi:Methionine synthase II (cobalamin-independent)